MRTTAPHGDSPRDDSQPSEQLVAYLDGELSAEESAQVERRLASDPALRQQLQELERSWAVLDALPAVTVAASFSQTTMELALAEGDQAPLERESATPDGLPLGRRWLAVMGRCSARRWGTVLVFAAAALCGAVCGRWLWPDPHQQLVANLPVIHYVNLYRQFEDPLFLRLLQQELGPPPWYDPAEAIRLEASARQFARLQDVAQRVAWLDQRQPAELTSLRAKFNQFQGLAVHERARLQHLQQQITTPRNAAVVPTMLQFQHWLRGLLPVEQDDLRRLPSAAARAERVVQLVRQQRRQRALALDERGPPTDQQLEEFFAAELPETEQERLLALPGEEMRVQLEQMYRGVPVRLPQPRPGWDGLPPPRRRGPPPPRRRRTWPESKRP